MVNCHLVNMKELNLKNLNDYLNAIKMITDIPSLIAYLKKYIIPIVADFPGQLFIRKAITLLRKQKEGQDISPDIIHLNHHLIIYVIIVIVNLKHQMKKKV
jgi:hypothetical protein